MGSLQLSALPDRQFDDVSAGTSTADGHSSLQTTLTPAEKAGQGSQDTSQATQQQLPAVMAAGDCPEAADAAATGPEQESNTAVAGRPPTGATTRDSAAASFAATQSSSNSSDVGGGADSNDSSSGDTSSSSSSRSGDTSTSSSSSSSSGGEPSSPGDSTAPHAPGATPAAAAAAAAVAAAAASAADAASDLGSKAADDDAAPPPSSQQQQHHQQDQGPQPDAAASKPWRRRCRGAPSRPRSRPPGPKHHQGLHDTLDALSLLLTTASLALSAVLCALCLQYPHLAWVGVLLLGVTIAAPVAVGGIILARNHWLVVVLRYCLSVAALQRDTGLSFAGVRWPPLRAALGWVLSGVLGVVGLVVAVYLSACYVVTAVLSVPLLDVSLLCSLVRPLRRRALAADLVFLESYKPARAMVSAVLQALPLAVLSALLLAATYSNGGPLPPAAAAAAAASGSSSSPATNTGPVIVAPNGTVTALRFVGVNGTNSSSSSSSRGQQGHKTGGHSRRLLLQQQLYAAAPPATAAAAAAALEQPSSRQQPLSLKGSVARALLVQSPATAVSSSSGSGSSAGDAPTAAAASYTLWDPRLAISQALAALLGSHTKSAAAAAGVGPAPSPSSSSGGGSNGSNAGTRQLLPTVAILSTEGASGGQRVQVALVLNPMVNGSNGLSSSSSSSSSNAILEHRDINRPWLGFMRGGGSGGDNSSGGGSSSVFVMATPSWAGLRASAPALPVGVLYAAAAVGLLDLLLVLLAAVLGCCAAGVGFWRQLGLTLRMRGGCKLPDDVTKEVVGQMTKDGGRRLLLSNVYHWDTHTSSGSSRLPLVPRYLFPPDGGWLVPGQVCFLARRALALMQQQQRQQAGTATPGSLSDSSTSDPSTSSGSSGGSNSSSGSSGGSSSSSSSSVSSIEVLEVDHSSCTDLSVLLGAAVGSGQLPGLTTVQLNWCCVGSRSLLPLLQGNSSSGGGSGSRTPLLAHLHLKRCEVSDLGAAHLKTLLAAPACSLKTLAMINCHMSSTAARAVAQGLGANSSLSSVRFSGNNGGKHAALAFATALRNNTTLQHLNLSFNKLCPSGGEALAAALSANVRLAAAAGSSAGSSERQRQQRGLQRLVVQRKEIGGVGLRAVITALRGITGHSGGLTLRVLQAPGQQGSAGTPANIRVLQLVELPVVFVCHENQEVLLSEDWLHTLLDKQQQQQGGASAADADAAECAAGVASNSSSSSSTRPSSSGSSASGGSSSSSSSSSAGDHAVIEIEVLQDSLQQQQQQQSPVASPSMLSAASSSSSSSSGKPPRQPGRVSGFAAAAAFAAPSPAKRGMAAAAASSSSSSSSLETSVSGVTDGLTPACSVAELGLLPSASTSSAAAAAGAAWSTSRQHGSGGGSGRCPQLIFLSQNDPGDNVAALLRAVEGVACVDLTGLQLSNKGVKSLAAALPEAKFLQQLILRATGLLDEGAAALAAALQQPHNSPTPSSANSNASPAAAAALTTSRSSTRSSSASSGGSSSSGGGSGSGSGSSSSSGTAAPSRHALRVLDLSRNIICDAGAADIAAAVEAGVLPQLRQLAVVDNRYPFDWSTVLQLQGLQVLQPGLRVDLGAPSSWCLTPSTVRPAATKSAHATTAAAGGAAAAAAAQQPLPAGWTPAEAGDGGSDGGSSVAQVAAVGGEVRTGGVSHAAASAALSVSSEDLCGVCFDAPNALYVDSCRHQLCIDCYKQLVKAAAAAAASSSRRHQQSSADGGAAGCAACPFCRAPMTGFKYSAWVQVEEEAALTPADA